MIISLNLEPIEWNIAAV